MLALRRVSLAKLGAAAALATAALLGAPQSAEALCQAGCSIETNGGPTGCGGIMCHGYSNSGCSVEWTGFSCPSVGGFPSGNPIGPPPPPSQGGGSGPGPTPTPAKSAKEVRCDAAIDRVKGSDAARQAAAQFAAKLGRKGQEVKQRYELSATECAKALAECVNVKITTSDDRGNSHVAYAQVCEREDRFAACVDKIPGGLAPAQTESRMKTCAILASSSPCLLAQAPSTDPGVISIATCARADQACGADCERTTQLPVPTELPNACAPSMTGFQQFLASGTPSGGPPFLPAPGCTPATQPTAPAFEPIYYLAAGDSYASGEAAPPYANAKRYLCHRSFEAYGSLLAHSFGFTETEIRAGLETPIDARPPWGPIGAFVMSACSGDMANEFIDRALADLVSETVEGFADVNRYAQWRRADREPQSPRLAQEFKLPNGVSSPRISPDIVTFSVGGNDIGFAELMAKCLVDDCTAADLNLDALVPGYKAFQRCVPTERDVADGLIPDTCNPDRAETIGNKLKRVIGHSIGLLASRARNSWVVIVGYPNPLPATHPNPDAARYNFPEDFPNDFWREALQDVKLRNFPFRCPAGITPDELRVIRDFVRDLNGEIRKIVDYFVNEQGVKNLLFFDKTTGGVPIGDLFAGYDVCAKLPYAEAVPGLLSDLPWASIGDFFVASTAEEIDARVVRWRLIVDAYRQKKEALQEPLHPNRYGHAKLGSELINFLLKQGILAIDWDRRRYVSFPVGDLDIPPTKLAARFRADSSATSPRNGEVGRNFQLAPSQLPGAPLPGIAISNAAMVAPRVAADALASLYGANLAADTAATGSGCAPTLGARRIVVQDADGVIQPACLLYVSPTQINFHMPAGIARPADGADGSVVTLTLLDSGGTALARGVATVRAVAPSIFTANFSGTGLPAGNVVRSRQTANGMSLSVEPLDKGIDMGPASDQLSLVIYATGLRGASAPERITATVNGAAAAVTKVEAVASAPGVDQITIRLPRALAEVRGTVPVVVRVNEPTLAPILDTNTVHVGIVGGEAAEDPGPGPGAGPGRRCRAENCSD